MVSLGQNLKFSKTSQKRLYNHIRVVLCKNGSKKHLIFEKWQLFENHQNWPPYKRYSLCKLLSLSQKIKFSKTCQKRLYNHIRVVLWNKRLQKTSNIRKMATYQNRHNWPPCKGYSLCKMVSLGQKLKFSKTCQKRLYNHIRVVLCKKTARKNTQYSRNGNFIKIVKIGHRAKAIVFAKWSVWNKN